MKLLIIGGNGTIGKVVVQHYRDNGHEVITAGRNSGDVNIDLTDTTSIAAMLESVGKVDHIVCAAGNAKWADFNEMSEDDFYIGIKDKLMGQVNLVRLGKDYLNEGGSITLSTGVTADDHVRLTSSGAMVGGALHSFVQAVVLDIKQPIRVNVVSLGVVEDAYDKYRNYFPGHNPIPMNKVVRAFSKSIDGALTGQVFRYYDNQ